MIRFTPTVQADAACLVCDIHQDQWLIGTLELWVDYKTHPVPLVCLRLLTSHVASNIQMPLLRGLEPDDA